MQNVKGAVQYGQRLKAAFYPGQVGLGKLCMEELSRPGVDLWNGVGLEASQKIELATADEMGWQYDAFDVADELEDRFPKGCVVDAWCEKRNCWRRGTVEGQKASKTLITWSVRCGLEGDVFQSSRVCDTSVAISEMLGRLRLDLSWSESGSFVRTHSLSQTSASCYLDLDLWSVAGNTNHETCEVCYSKRAASMANMPE